MNDSALEDSSDLIYATEKKRTTKTDAGPCELHFKTVFVGDRCTGKTQLSRKLRQSELNPLIQSTVEKDIFEVGVHIGSLIALLDVWDTGGQERYRSLAPIFFRNSYLCVFVYDITTRSTFDSLRDWWLPQFLKMETGVPALDAGPHGLPNIAIVGTHSDLDHLRQVDLASLNALADEYGVMFAEVSSIDVQGAAEFERIATLLTLNAAKSIGVVKEVVHEKGDPDGGSFDESLEKSITRLCDFRNASCSSDDSETDGFSDDDGDGTPPQDMSADYLLPLEDCDDQILEERAQQSDDSSSSNGAGVNCDDTSLWASTFETIPLTEKQQSKLSSVFKKPISKATGETGQSSGMTLRAYKSDGSVAAEMSNVNVSNCCS